jgi:hypothetical protein
MRDFSYEPPIEDRILLEGAVRYALTKIGKSPLTTIQRRRISDRIATNATTYMLRAILPNSEITDANSIRMNNPGFDLLVDRRLRLQIKGNSNYETVQFRHKASGSGRDMEYDLVVIVDIGVTLDVTDSVPQKKRLPVKSGVDFYIIPNQAIRNWLAEGRCVNAFGNWIHFYKTPSKASGQIPEMRYYLNRYSLLEEALAR